MSISISNTFLIPLVKKLFEWLSQYGDEKSVIPEGLPCARAIIQSGEISQGFSYEVARNFQMRKVLYASDNGGIIEVSMVVSISAKRILLPDDDIIEKA